jgi:hypothetical protein
MSRVAFKGGLAFFVWRKGEKMKKVLRIFLALILFLGCTADKVTFRESTNFNYLDLGSYQIGIDKKFEFVGDVDAKGKADTVEGVTQGRYKIDTYVFADASNGKENIKRAIAVTVITITDTTYWRGEASFANYKSNENIQVLHKGTNKLNDINVAMVVFTTKRINPKILKMADSKGYRPASDMKQGIDVKFGKVIGRSRLINIEYLEASEENQPNAINYVNNAKQVITLEKR